MEPRKGTGVKRRLKARKQDKSLSPGKAEETVSEIQRVLPGISDKLVPLENALKKIKKFMEVIPQRIYLNAAKKGHTLADRNSDKKVKATVKDIHSLFVEVPKEIAPLLNLIKARPGLSAEEQAKELGLSVRQVYEMRTSLNKLGQLNKVGKNILLLRNALARDEAWRNMRPLYTLIKLTPGASYKAIAETFGLKSEDTAKEWMTQLRKISEKNDEKELRQVLKKHELWKGVRDIYMILKDHPGLPGKQLAELLSLSRNGDESELGFDVYRSAYRKFERLAVKDPDAAKVLKAHKKLMVVREKKRTADIVKSRPYWERKGPKRLTAVEEANEKPAAEEVTVKYTSDHFKNLILRALKNDEKAERDLIALAESPLNHNQALRAFKVLDDEKRKNKVVWDHLKEFLALRERVVNGHVIAAASEKKTVPSSETKKDWFVESIKNGKDIPKSPPRWMGGQPMASDKELNVSVYDITDQGIESLLKAAPSNPEAVNRLMEFRIRRGPALISKVYGELEGMPKDPYLAINFVLARYAILENSNRILEEKLTARLEKELKAELTNHDVKKAVNEVPKSRLLRLVRLRQISSYGLIEPSMKKTPLTKILSSNQPMLKKDLDAYLTEKYLKADKVLEAVLAVTRCNNNDPRSMAARNAALSRLGVLSKADRHGFVETLYEALDLNKKAVENFLQTSQGRQYRRLLIEPMIRSLGPLTEGARQFLKDDEGVYELSAALKGLEKGWEENLKDLGEFITAIDSSLKSGVPEEEKADLSLIFDRLLETYIVYLVNTREPDPHLAERYPFTSKLPPALQIQKAQLASARRAGKESPITLENRKLLLSRSGVLHGALGYKVYSPLALNPRKTQGIMEKHFPSPSKSADTERALFEPTATKQGTTPERLAALPQEFSYDVPEPVKSSTDQQVAKQLKNDPELLAKVIQSMEKNETVGKIVAMLFTQHRIVGRKSKLFYAKPEDIAFKLGGMGLETVMRGLEYLEKKGAVKRGYDKFAGQYLLTGEMRKAVTNKAHAMIPSRAAPTVNLQLKVLDYMLSKAGIPASDTPLSIEELKKLRAEASKNVGKRAAYTTETVALETSVGETTAEEVLGILKVLGRHGYADLLEELYIAGEVPKQSELTHKVNVNRGLLLKLGLTDKYGIVDRIKLLEVYGDDLEEEAETKRWHGGSGASWFSGNGFPSGMSYDRVVEKLRKSETEGFTTEDSIYLIKALEEEGIDSGIVGQGFLAMKGGLKWLKETGIKEEGVIGRRAGILLDSMKIERKDFERFLHRKLPTYTGEEKELVKYYKGLRTQLLTIRPFDHRGKVFNIIDSECLPARTPKDAAELLLKELRSEGLILERARKIINEKGMPPSQKDELVKKFFEYMFAKLQEENQRTASKTKPIVAKSDGFINDPLGGASEPGLENKLHDSGLSDGDRAYVAGLITKYFNDQSDWPAAAAKFNDLRKRYKAESVSNLRVLLIVTKGYPAVYGTLGSLMEKELDDAGRFFLNYVTGLSINARYQDPLTFSQYLKELGDIGLVQIPWDAAGMRCMRPKGEELLGKVFGKPLNAEKISTDEKASYELIHLDSIEDMERKIAAGENVSIDAKTARNLLFTAGQEANTNLQKKEEKNHSVRLVRSLIEHHESGANEKVLNNALQEMNGARHSVRLAREKAYHRIYKTNNRAKGRTVIVKYAEAREAYEKAVRLYDGDATELTLSDTAALARAIGDRSLKKPMGEGVSVFHGDSEEKMRWAMFEIAKNNPHLCYLGIGSAAREFSAAGGKENIKVAERLKNWQKFFGGRRDQEAKHVSKKAEGNIPDGGLPVEMHIERIMGTITKPSQLVGTDIYMAAFYLSRNKDPALEARMREVLTKRPKLLKAALARMRPGDDDARLVLQNIMGLDVVEKRIVEHLAKDRGHKRPWAIARDIGRLDIKIITKACGKLVGSGFIERAGGHSDVYRYPEEKVPEVQLDGEGAKPAREENKQALSKDLRADSVKEAILEASEGLDGSSLADLLAYDNAFSGTRKVRRRQIDGALRNLERQGEIRREGAKYFPAKKKTSADDPNDGRFKATIRLDDHHQEGLPEGQIDLSSDLVVRDILLKDAKLLRRAAATATGKRGSELKVICSLFFPNRIGSLDHIRKKERRYIPGLIKEHIVRAGTGGYFSVWGDVRKAIIDQARENLVSAGSGYVRKEETELVKEIRKVEPSDASLRISEARERLASDKTLLVKAAESLAGGPGLESRIIAYLYGNKGPCSIKTLREELKVSVRALADSLKELCSPERAYIKRLPAKKVMLWHRTREELENHALAKSFSIRKDGTSAVKVYLGKAPPYKPHYDEEIKAERVLEMIKGGKDGLNELEQIASNKRSRLFDAFEELRGDQEFSDFLRSPQGVFLEIAQVLELQNRMGRACIDSYLADRIPDESKLEQAAAFLYKAKEIDRMDLETVKNISLLSILLKTPQGPREKDASLDALKGAAHELMNMRRYGNAENYLTKLISLDPSNKKAEYELLLCRKLLSADTGSSQKTLGRGNQDVSSKILMPYEYEEAYRKIFSDICSLKGGKGALIKNLVYHLTTDLKGPFSLDEAFKTLGEGTNKYTLSKLLALLTRNGYIEKSRSQHNRRYVTTKTFKELPLKFGKETGLISGAGGAGSFNSIAPDLGEPDFGISPHVLAARKHGIGRQRSHLFIDRMAAVPTHETENTFKVDPWIQKYFPKDDWSAIKQRFLEIKEEGVGHYGELGALVRVVLEKSPKSDGFQRRGETPESRIVIALKEATGLGDLSCKVLLRIAAGFDLDDIRLDMEFSPKDKRLEKATESLRHGGWIEGVFNSNRKFSYKLRTWGVVDLMRALSGGKVMTYPEGSIVPAEEWNAFSGDFGDVITSLINDRLTRKELVGNAIYALVLGCREKGYASRQYLETKAGISRQTLKKILDYLEEEGYVTCKGAGPSEKIFPMNLGQRIIDYTKKTHQDKAGATEENIRDSHEGNVINTEKAKSLSLSRQIKKSIKLTLSPDSLNAVGILRKQVSKLPEDKKRELQEMAGTMGASCAIVPGEMYSLPGMSIKQSFQEDDVIVLVTEANTPGYSGKPLLLINGKKPLIAVLMALAHESDHLLREQLKIHLGRESFGARDSERASAVVDGLWAAAYKDLYWKLTAASPEMADSFLLYSLDEWVKFYSEFRDETDDFVKDFPGLAPEELFKTGAPLFEVEATELAGLLPDEGKELTKAEDLDKVFCGHLSEIYSEKQDLAEKHLGKLYSEKCQLCQAAGIRKIGEGTYRVNDKSNSFIIKESGSRFTVSLECSYKLLSRIAGKNDTVSRSYLKTAYKEFNKNMKIGLESATLSEEAPDVTVFTALSRAVKKDLETRTDWRRDVENKIAKKQITEIFPKNLKTEAWNKYNQYRRGKECMDMDDLSILAKVVSEYPVVRQRVAAALAEVTKIQGSYRQESCEALIYYISKPGGETLGIDLKKKLGFTKGSSKKVYDPLKGGEKPLINRQIKDFEATPEAREKLRQAFRLISGKTENIAERPDQKNNESNANAANGSNLFKNIPAGHYPHFRDLFREIFNKPKLGAESAREIIYHAAALCSSKDSFEFMDLPKELRKSISASQIRTVLQTLEKEGFIKSERKGQLSNKYTPTPEFKDLSKKLSEVIYLNELAKSSLQGLTGSLQPDNFQKAEWKKSGEIKGAQATIDTVVIETPKGKSLDAVFKEPLNWGKPTEEGEQAKKLADIINEFRAQQTAYSCDRAPMPYAYDDRPIEKGGTGKIVMEKLGEQWSILNPETAYMAFDPDFQADLGKALYDIHSKNISHNDLPSIFNTEGRGNIAFNEQGRVIFLDYGLARLGDAITKELLIDQIKELDNLTFYSGKDLSTEEKAEYEAARLAVYKAYMVAGGMERLRKFLRTDPQYFSGALGTIPSEYARILVQDIQELEAAKEDLKGKNIPLDPSKRDVVTERVEPGELLPTKFGEKLSRINARNFKHFLDRKVYKAGTKEPDGQRKQARVLDNRYDNRGVYSGVIGDLKKDPEKRKLFLQFLKQNFSDYSSIENALAKKEVLQTLYRNKPFIEENFFKSKDTMTPVEDFVGFLKSAFVKDLLAYSERYKNIGLTRKAIDAEGRKIVLRESGLNHIADEHFDDFAAAFGIADKEGLADIVLKIVRDRKPVIGKLGYLEYADSVDGTPIKVVVDPIKGEMWTAYIGDQNTVIDHVIRQSIEQTANKSGDKTAKWENGKYDPLPSVEQSIKITGEGPDELRSSTNARAENLLSGLSADREKIIKILQEFRAETGLENVSDPAKKAIALVDWMVSMRYGGQFTYDEEGSWDINNLLTTYKANCYPIAALYAILGGMEGLDLEFLSFAGHLLLRMNLPDGRFALVEPLEEDPRRRVRVYDPSKLRELPELEQNYLRSLVKVEYEDVMKEMLEFAADENEAMDDGAGTEQPEYAGESSPAYTRAELWWLITKWMSAEKKSIDAGLRLELADAIYSKVIANCSGTLSAIRLRLDSEEKESLKKAGWILGRLNPDADDGLYSLHLPAGLATAIYNEYESKRAEAAIRASAAQAHPAEKWKGGPGASYHVRTGEEADYDVHSLLLTLASLNNEHLPEDVMREIAEAYRIDVTGLRDEKMWLRINSALDRKLTIIAATSPEIVSQEIAEVESLLKKKDFSADVRQMDLVRKGLMEASLKKYEMMRTLGVRYEDVRKVFERFLWDTSLRVDDSAEVKAAILADWMMSQRYGGNFSYSGNFHVRDLLGKGNGNCIALMTLYKFLAQEIGLDFEFMQLEEHVFGRVKLGDDKCLAVDLLEESFDKRVQKAEESKKYAQAVPVADEHILLDVMMREYSKNAEYQKAEEYASKIIEGYESLIAEGRKEYLPVLNHYRLVVADLYSSRATSDKQGMEYRNYLLKAVKYYETIPSDSRYLNDPGVWMKKGDALSELGEYDKALKAYSTVVSTLYSQDAPVSPENKYLLEAKEKIAKTRLMKEPSQRWRRLYQDRSDGSDITEGGIMKPERNLEIVREIKASGSSAALRAGHVYSLIIYREAFAAAHGNTEEIDGMLRWAASVNPVLTAKVIEQLDSDNPVHRAGARVLAGDLLLENENLLRKSAREYLERLGKNGGDSAETDLLAHLFKTNDWETTGAIKASLREGSGEGMPSSEHYITSRLEEFEEEEIIETKKLKNTENVKIGVNALQGVIDAAAGILFASGARILTQPAGKTIATPPQDRPRTDWQGDVIAAVKQLSASKGTTARGEPIPVSPKEIASILADKEGWGTSKEEGIEKVSRLCMILSDDVASGGRKKLIKKDDGYLLVEAKEGQGGGRGAVYRIMPDVVGPEYGISPKVLAERKHGINRPPTNVSFIDQEKQLPMDPIAVSRSTPARNYYLITPLGKDLLNLFLNEEAAGKPIYARYSSLVNFLIRDEQKREEFAGFIWRNVTSKEDFLALRKRILSGEISDEDKKLIGFLGGKAFAGSMEPEAEVAGFLKIALPHLKDFLKGESLKMKHQSDAEPATGITIPDTEEPKPAEKAEEEKTFNARPMLPETIRAWIDRPEVVSYFKDGSVAVSPSEEAGKLRVRARTWDADGREIVLRVGDDEYGLEHIARNHFGAFSNLAGMTASEGPQKLMDAVMESVRNKKIFRPAYTLKGRQRIEYAYRAGDRLISTVVDMTNHSIITSYPINKAQKESRIKDGKALRREKEWRAEKRASDQTKPLDKKTDASRNTPAEPVEGDVLHSRKYDPRDKTGLYMIDEGDNVFARGEAKKSNAGGQTQSPWSKFWEDEHRDRKIRNVEGSFFPYSVNAQRKFFGVDNPRIRDFGTEYLSGLSGKQHFWLNIGGGSSSPLQHLSAKLGHKGRLLNIDISETAVKASNELGVESRVMDAQHLDLEDNSVDVVFMSFVAEHTPEPQKVFGEISRVLKLGGKAIIRMHHPDNVIIKSYRHSLSERYVQTHEEMKVSVKTLLDNIDRYGSKWGELLEKAGLKVEKQEDVAFGNGKPAFRGFVVRKPLAEGPPAFVPPKPVENPIDPKTADDSIKRQQEAVSRASHTVKAIGPPPPPDDEWRKKLYAFLYENGSGTGIENALNASHVSDGVASVADAPASPAQGLNVNENDAGIDDSESIPGSSDDEQLYDEEEQIILNASPEELAKWKAILEARRKELELKGQATQKRLWDIPSPSTLKEKQEAALAHIAVGKESEKLLQKWVLLNQTISSRSNTEDAGPKTVKDRMDEFEEEMKKLRDKRNGSPGGEK